jgi:uncharacterized protein (DUF1330 family)
MSCYFLAQIIIHNPAEYRKYLDGFDAVFNRHKGTVLAVDDAPVLLEGRRHGRRTVLIRFPDEHEALRWYRSPEYQKLAEHRRAAADSDIVLLSGRD